MAKKPAPTAEPDTIVIRGLDDLKPDDRNANRGNERGRRLIAKSVKDLGLGRSIVVDKNGKTIAGNKTLEAATAAGVAGVKVVQTTGHELVIVQRVDLDLDNDPAARALALADNRTAEVDLDWDAQQIQRDELDYGLQLDEIGFTEGEIADMEAEAAELGLDTTPGTGRNLSTKATKATVKVVIAVDRVETVERALIESGLVNRGDALLEICEFYVKAKGQQYAAAEGEAPEAGAG
jgi:hypothetical protein